MKLEENIGKKMELCHTIKTQRGEAWFSVIEGTVQDCQTQVWNETRVGGDNGYVVSSNVKHQQERIWVEVDNGKQICVELQNSGFRVAPGHIVRIAWGGRKSKNGQYLFAHNWTSQQTFDLNHGQWWKWGKKID